MALVTVPGRENGELLRGEERESCKGGRELQVKSFRPDRTQMFGKVRRDPF